MRSFWSYLGELKRYPASLAVAFACAGISALSLGVGFAGIAPIIETILEGGDGGSPRGLSEMARDFNGSLVELPLLPGFAARLLTIPDGVIAELPPKPYHAVLWIMIGLGGLTIVGALTTFTHQYLSISVVQRTVTELRRRAYEKALRSPLGDLVASGTADPIARVVSDTAALGEGLTAVVSRGVFQVSRGLASFGVALYFNWRLTIVAVAVAPVLGAIVSLLGRRIKKATRRALREQASLYGSALNALRALRVVKVHTTEAHELRNFTAKNLEVMRQVFRARTARALSSPSVEVITLITLGVLTVVATKAVLDGQLDPESMLMSLGALFVTATALRPLTGIVTSVQAASGAAERVGELFEAPDEPGYDPSLPELARHAESLSFEGVAFSYPGATARALDGVDLRIEAGERVAFVGPNGSGKTTLLSLVPRLYDLDEGSVLIDGTDLRRVNVASLRRQLGVVTQETVLFPGSVRENIAYGVTGKTDAEIRDAAEKARAWGFIEKLPGVLDAEVAEQGLSLSGGQRQRISIARAILRDPAVLILDEATSMIDAESEAAIGEALDEFSRGRTTLVVAHRLSTVVGADRIVVMDRGRVEDVGKHDELLGRCRVYQMLAKTQLVGAHETRSDQF
ncbi:MAG: ABC transporter ATP-binding protein [Planctomycetota bacterium]